MDLEQIKYIKKCLEINNRIKEQGKKIQENYSFIIPDYILEEIVKNKEYSDTLLSFINLAKINERLTEEEAMVLKRDFIMQR